MLFSLYVKWSHFNKLDSCHRKCGFLSGCPPLCQCYPGLVITTLQTGHRQTTKGSPPHNNCFISDFSYLFSDQSLLFVGAQASLESDWGWKYDVLHFVCLSVWSSLHDEEDKIIRSPSKQSIH